MLAVFFITTYDYGKSKSIVLFSLHLLWCRLRSIRTGKVWSLCGCEQLSNLWLVFTWFVILSSRCLWVWALASLSSLVLLSVFALLEAPNTGSRLLWCFKDEWKQGKIAIWKAILILWIFIQILNHITSNTPLHCEFFITSISSFSLRSLSCTSFTNTYKLFRKIKLLLSVIILNTSTYRT